MKNFTRSFVMLGIVLIVSISSLRAQSSPLTIVTTPTQVNLTNSGGPLQQVVNIKMTPLPLLVSLTSVNVTIQGADASQFTVEQPSLSLNELITALRGDGLNVTVTYKPTSTGTHNANLLINASLLGVLFPIQKTVPITGVCVPYPQMTGSNPANGATNVAVISGANVFFSENVTLVDASKISVNGDNTYSVSIVQGSGNDYVRISGKNFPIDETVTVVIGAGAIKGTSNNLNVSDYSFSFHTAKGPQLASITPSPDTSLDFSPYSNGTPLTITLTFESGISLLSPAGRITTSNSAWQITSIVVPPTGTPDPSKSIKITVVYQQPFIPVYSFTLNIAQGVIIDYATSDPYKGGNWTYTFNPLARIANEMIDNKPPVKSETYYNVTGMQVNSYSLQPGTVYIKKRVYTDGSSDAIKYLHTRM